MYYVQHMDYVFASGLNCSIVNFNTEMLAELSRREKDANIKPDPDLDIFMKVMT